MSERLEGGGWEGRGKSENEFVEKVIERERKRQ